MRIEWLRPRAANRYTFLLPSNITCLSASLFSGPLTSIKVSCSFLGRHVVGTKLLALEPTWVCRPLVDTDHITGSGCCRCGAITLHSFLRTLWNSQVKWWPSQSLCMGWKSAFFSPVLPTLRLFALPSSSCFPILGYSTKEKGICCPPRGPWPRQHSLEWPAQLSGTCDHDA